MKYAVGISALVISLSLMLVPLGNLDLLSNIIPEIDPTKGVFQLIILVTMFFALLLLFGGLFSLFNLRNYALYLFLLAGALQIFSSGNGFESAKMLSIISFGLAAMIVIELIETKRKQMMYEKKSEGNKQDRINPSA